MESIGGIVAVVVGHDYDKIYVDYLEMNGNVLRK